METSVGCNGQVRYYENRGEILHAWCPSMYTQHGKDEIRKRERLREAEMNQTYRQMEFSRSVDRMSHAR